MLFRAVLTALRPGVLLLSRLALLVSQLAELISLPRGKNNSVLGFEVSLLVFLYLLFFK